MSKLSGYRGLAIGMLLVMFAALAALPTTAAPNNQELIVAYYLEPDTLNPYGAHNPAGSDMHINEGFATTDDKMRYIPLEAQQIPSPANGGAKMVNGKLVVTWKLKPGLKWSDGQPATSADAVFTAKAMQDPSFITDNREGWTLIDSVEAPDPLTVVITYKTVYAAYQNMFHYLMPKHILEGKDLNTYTAYNRFPVTTGPYVVRQWVAGQYIVAVANPYYRDAAKGVPRIKKMTWRFVKDANTRINMLKAGEAQAIWSLPFDQIKPLQSTPGVQAVVYQMNAWLHFDFNLKKPIFQDVRLRQAVAYAIDKEGIVKGVAGGLGIPAGPPISPLSWAHNPNAYKQYKYDPAKAKELVTQAGWQLGPDGILTKDGRRFTFANCGQTGDSTWDKAQQVIQAGLRNIGMDMQIQNYSVTVYGGIRLKGECDTLFHRWKVAAPPNLSIFYSADSMPPMGLNQVFYNNPTLTKLVADAENTIDQQKAKSLFWRAQDILADDLPTIPVYYLYGANAAVSGLHGFIGNPTNAGDGWNNEQWYLAP
jgi:peptide/nickel transport system substrate-binding protein